MEDCLVIGSGPAAAAATHALIEKGSEVTVLDAGLELEERYVQIRARLASVEPEQWLAEDVELMKAATAASRKGVPTKAVYGSDFARRTPSYAGALETYGAKVMRSFALGGLTNLWGACIVPYGASDLEGWPIEEHDLAPHYEAVRQMIAANASAAEAVRHRGDAGRSYADDSLPLSRQAASLLSDLEAAQSRLNAKGVSFERSTLAVANSPARPCRRCGMCLYGCPYGLIFNSADTIARLVREHRVTYRRGLLVTRFNEKPGCVEVHAMQLSNGEPMVMHAKRLFIGAGVIETARLVLASGDHYDRPVTLLGSDRFLLPFVRWRATCELDTERLHTLCQLFIRMDLPEVCSRAIHLQVYTYNDLFRRVLEPGSEFGKVLVQYPINRLLARLMIFNGYLPSSVSSHVLLTLRGGSPAKPRLECKGVVSPQSRTVVRRLIRTLWRECRSFGGVPMLPTHDPPGGGNHCGGTFPMRSNPGVLECDVLGRPSGHRRVHIVDASTFTSVAGSTIAFTAMANGHRIGTLAGSE